jgi:response regulator RpfG family c-di-GMP phosphodiesterase
MTGWRDLPRAAVLVVDDDDAVRGAIVRFLEQEHHTVLAAPGIDVARELLLQRDVIAVVCDVTLAGESGLDLLAEVKRLKPEVEVLIMTGNADVQTAIEALHRGAYDFLRKPFAWETLRAALARAIEHHHLGLKVRMMDQIEERRVADAEHLRQFLTSMATVIDAKSRFTARHSERVSDLSRLLAEALFLPADRVQLVALGGRLHDIGKIGTPDAILDKAGPLTREEYEVMKLHPMQGDELIAPMHSLAPLRCMIRWHHENLDGSGYPDGLPGANVPLEAWIVKTADYWEAITSRRPYRDPMPLDLAAKTLRAEAGVKIPVEVVETFLSAIVHAPIALPAVGAV